MVVRKKKHEFHEYTISLDGVLEEEFISACLPPDCDIQVKEGITTLSNVRSDQSGMVGLIRHLHNLGCTILSIYIV